MAEIAYSIDRFVFAIAGPIVDGKCKFTNVNWIISEEEIKKITNNDYVKFINDLEAQSYYIPHLKDQDTFTVQKGQKKQNKNICIIAPGTGLGEAFLTWDGNSYVAHATEGGHTSFSPENELEMELLQYLRNKLNARVSKERVCSGIGIKNIFDFLVQTKKFTMSERLHEELKSKIDPVPSIMKTALSDDEDCEICDKTIQMFLQILGSECGDFALKIMALGGIYISGGIPSKILKAFETDYFIKAFTDKGRMSPILEKIPVFIVKNEKIGILGAAYFSLQFKEWII